MPTRGIRVETAIPNKMSHSREVKIVKLRIIVRTLLDWSNNYRVRQKLRFDRNYH